MAHRSRYAPTTTPPGTIPGFYLTDPTQMPNCPECKTGELFEYLDHPTQIEEIVCLECGHVVPRQPPSDSSEWPVGTPSGGRASTAAPPPPVEKSGGNPGDPPGAYADMVLAARAFAVAALADRWRRVEVVVIGHDGLPALTVTTHRRD